MVKGVSKLQRYNPKVKGKGIHHPLLAIDVENDPKTGAFICAGVYGERKRWKRGHKDTIAIEEYFENQDDLCSYLSNLNKSSCILVFFNLSYDKIFLNAIIDPNSVLSNGTRTISCKLIDNHLLLMDMGNHVDGSLESWINHLDMPKKYGVEKKSLSNLKDRVMNDAKATFHLAAFIEDFYYYECGMPLKLTVSSNAFLLFRKYYLKDLWIRKHDRRQELEQESYYGGRVECIRRGESEYWGYDLNSAYLSIMRDNIFPDMSSSHHIEYGDSWKKYWDRGYQMIMRCKVDVPYNHIPVLPHRVNGKLCFPIGTFTGTWTSVELAKAMECGAKILKCYEFVYYTKSKPYFRDFAQFVWSKRKEYKSKGNKGMDLMIKKIGNSLYGKFAQRNDVGSYLGLMSDYKGKFPERVKPFQYKGLDYIQVSGNLEPAQHYFPALSAFITSFCRLKLYTGIEANLESVLYYDTDSLKLSKPASGITINDDLGNWGFEGTDVTSFYRPKMYGSKRKGVPKRAQLIDDNDKHEHYVFDKPLREREALKSGRIANSWIEYHKYLSKDDDKREWYWGDNTSTPLLIEDDELKTVKVCECCGVFTYDWEILRSVERHYRKGGGWHGGKFFERRVKWDAGRTIENVYCKECHDNLYWGKV